MSGYLNNTILGKWKKTNKNSEPLIAGCRHELENCVPFYVIVVSKDVALVCRGGQNVEEQAAICNQEGKVKANAFVEHI